MQDNQGNEEKDDTIWNNKSPVKTNQNNGNLNDENIPNKNLLLSNRSSKVTTKISKLIYDPQNQSNRAIVKNTYTYGHKIPLEPPSPRAYESASQLDNGKVIKTATFKTRDINKFPDNKSNDSPDITITNPVNKNHEFLKKKLEREKDIEDIQKMLNQINTSCHENDTNQFQNPLTNLNLTNKLNQNETKTPTAVAQTELNLDLNNITHNFSTNQNMSKSEMVETNLKIYKNNQKLDPSEFDLQSTRSQTVINLNEKNFNNKKNDPSELELQLQRSQTDMNLKAKFLLSPQKPVSSRTVTPKRSKSSINLYSRDSSKLTLDTAVTKKKSYDPNEARRFMKEQRIKRQQKIQKEQKGLSPQNKTNAGVDKEAIKKRLEELRKCTLKILEKNVKIKEKQDKFKKSDYNEENCMLSNQNTTRNRTVLKQSNSKGVLKLEKPQKNDKIDKEFLNKKIGLLRKPETEENSFSAIKDFNINKENLHFNMKTPTLIAENSQQQSDNGFRQISDTVIFKRVQEKSIFENNNTNLNENLKKSNSLTTTTQQHTQQISKYENEHELKIPDKKLERKVSLREKSIQVDPTPTVKKAKNELPYWLKPTPVQYYPYNFIMAVRKKLEAITNPVITSNDNSKKYEKHLRKSNKTQETPLTYPKDRKEAVRRRIVDEKNFNLNVNDSTEQNINVPIKKNKLNVNEKDNCGHTSKSLSEITSNFSSISIHVPESHTISDMSSIASKKPQKVQKALANSTQISDQQQQNIKMLSTKLNFIHEDDTTISSSVFSSPEKKIIKKPNSFDVLDKNGNIELLNTGPLSPLSVDNINKLKIKSKSNLDKVNLERGNTGGNNFELPQQLQLIGKSKLGLKNQNREISSISKTNSSRGTQKSENLDFSQLLEDFNKSLSQVIEVNQQLKETLKKSNQMLSPNKNDVSHKVITSRSSSRQGEYMSDFEKEISKKYSNNGEKNFKVTGSIQSKTDEYTSDFEEEEQTSLEKEESITNRNNTNTAKSDTKLNFSQPEASLISIPNEKLQSISSNTKSPEEYKETVQEISTNQSQITNTTEEFLDSIEENSKIKTNNSNSISEHITTESIVKNKEVIENVIVEDTEENSIHKNNNQSSKDTLIDHLMVSDNSISELKNEFINNHINNSRGDFNATKPNDDESKSDHDLISNTITITQPIENNTGRGPPPAYAMPQPDENIPIKETSNSSICSEFIAVFNRSDVELSIYSQNESSEATLSYSSIGMYEQLLQTETSKSDHLAGLLKMREKALMDRTRGQIAWLEVQKEKYKSKGLSGQISHIKKKQRAILMKMEKEREEIKKLIQNQQNQISAKSIANDRQQQQQKIRSYRPKLAENISDISIRKNFTINSNTTTTTTTNKIQSSQKIIRGFEIQSNQNLEIILQKREEELRKRRAHVECLMEWHQRLDKEEQEVFQLERMLFEHNVIVAPEKIDLQTAQQQLTTTKYQLDKLKNEKKLFEINKSLRELQNISSRSTDSTTGNQNFDYVRTTGNKLNKLWRRLTGQKNIEKFEINKKYKLYKNDLEKLYEEAKEEVLREFGNQKYEMMELFEQSKCVETTGASSLENSADNQFIVPRLNLNFSSGQSDLEQVTNSSSVFYESTIQKQFQADIIENVEDYSITESNIATSGILSSNLNENQLNEIVNIDFEKSERNDNIENMNFERIEKQNNENNDLSNKFVEQNNENIEKTKIIPELLAGFEYSVTNTIEKLISTDENHSESSKIQITNLTDISDITESKTSGDIDSLSLEEQNKLFENNTKSVILDTNFSENLQLTQSTSNSSTKIESNSEQNSIALNENIDSSNVNVDRVSVIVSPVLPNEKSSEKGAEENLVEKSPISQIILEESIAEKSTETESLAQPSQTEEIIKFSEEINSEEVLKTTDEAPMNSELTVETSKTDYSSTLENDSISNSIKSEIEFSNDKLNETNSNIISPKNSINSEKFESPKILDNSKLSSESPNQCISNETFTLSEQYFTNKPILTNSSISINSPILTASQIEPQTASINVETDEYENDFSGSDMTLLDDITAPQFETTMDDTKSILDESNIVENNHHSNDEKSNSTTDLEKRLIDLDVSLKGLHDTFDRALSPDKNSITTPSPPLLSPPLCMLTNKSVSSDDNINIKYDLEKTKFSLSPRNYINSNNENSATTTLMPDIINEVEIRRRQQILIESEIKQLEQTVPPYVFLREIPNKPPPPYVPPAHGSPMTIIFPSEQRIKEITFRRTKELYDEILKTDKKTDNDSINSTPITPIKFILDENITNIYERIILDICKECMQEYKEILENLNPETYKNSLALFNPPDRLKCMQEFVYRHVRKLLAMEKKTNILQKNSIISIGRKKRDHVDEILIQELYEEEQKWTNFDQEEEEVKLAIVDEILNDLVKDVIGEVTDMNQKKLEFLTNYSLVNLNLNNEET